MAEQLTAEELALLARVDEEFADCGETEVPYEALMDFAQRGYLRCERFAFTDKGAQAVLGAHGVPASDGETFRGQAPAGSSDQPPPGDAG